MAELPPSLKPLSYEEAIRDLLARVEALELRVRTLEESPAMYPADTLSAEALTFPIGPASQIDIRDFGVVGDGVSCDPNPTSHQSDSPVSTPGDSVAPGAIAALL